MTRDKAVLEEQLKGAIFRIAVVREEREGGKWEERRVGTAVGGGRGRKKRKRGEEGRERKLQSLFLIVAEPRAGGLFFKLSAPATNQIGPNVQAAGRFDQAVALLGH